MTINDNTNILEMLPEGFNGTQLKQAFEEELASRSYLDAHWETYGRYTLPYVYPQEHHTESTELTNDYQSTGARAVNALTNKLANTLFSPSRPFFRIELNDEQKKEAAVNGIKDEDIEELTSATEKAAMKELDKVGLRTAVLNALKSLIITGNALMYIPQDKTQKAQVYSLRDYVIKRDMSGNMITTITRDKKGVSALPVELQAQVRAAGITDPNHEVIIYTGVFRVNDGRFVVKQEIEDLLVIPNRRGIYKPDDLPWIPLTWNLARGNQYGTGLVEEYAGAFGSLSSLSQSMHNMVAIASDIKGLVDPMGQTDISALNNSEPGTWCYGNREDVEYLQLEKLQDLNFIENSIATLKKEIGQGFLIGSAGQRDAERVTTVEIERDAYELEETLGGIYSRLAEELQRPVAVRLLSGMSGDLADLEIQVITGMDALSRKSEIEAIRMLFEDLSTINALPEETREYLEMGPLIKVFAAHRQVDYRPFTKTQEQVEEARQRQADREAAMVAQQEQAKQPQQM